MTNKLYETIQNGKPFIYFHTLLFNQKILNLANNSGRSIEIDISMDAEGKLFIGHPYEFYEFKHIIPPPQNLPIQTIVKEAKESDLYLVLDCKDVRALPAVQQIIVDYGASNCLFHSWLQELQFKPYAPEITIEPHWKYEDLPMDKVLELKSATGVPIISSARGLTLARLNDEPQIVKHIIDIAKGKIDAINFNLPNYAAPPKWIIDKLLDNGILTWLNVDYVPEADLPKTFVGISDHISHVTGPKSYKK